MCLHSWNVFFPHSIRFRPRKYITIVCRSCEQVFWGWCSFFIFVLSLYQSKSQMYMYGAKSNLGKSKFQANAVSGLTLKRTWSVGCPQGLLLILCLMFYFMLPFRADHCAWSVAFALKRMLPANTPPPPFLVCALVSVGSSEYFPLNSFTVTVTVGSCMHRGVPHIL